MKLCTKLSYIFSKKKKNISQFGTKFHSTSTTFLPLNPSIKNLLTITKNQKKQEKIITMSFPSFFPIIFFFLLTYTTTILAQTTSPLNITAILEKAGQFNTLIRLLKSTQLADQINNQINTSNIGITLFAPTDNAFSSLPPGTLNSLNDQQKVSLMQFHVIPSVITISQFQTVSNPLRTQAGNTNNGQFPLNVTSFGSQVNISTGVVNTSVSNALYSDSKLAVYQVDKVLLPMEMFGNVAPAPGPAEGSRRRKKRDAADAPTTDSKQAADASYGFRFDGIKSGKLVVFVVVGSFFWLSF